MKRITVYFLVILMGCMLLLTGCSAADGNINSQKAPSVEPQPNADENTVEMETEISEKPYDTKTPEPSDEPAETEPEETTADIAIKVMDVDPSVTEMPNGNNVNFGGINFYIDDPEYCTSTQSTDDAGNVIKTWTYPLIQTANNGMIEIEAIGDPFATLSTEMLVDDTVNMLSELYDSGEILSEGSRNIGDMEATVIRFGGEVEVTDGSEEVFVYTAVAYDTNTHTHYKFTLTIPAQMTFDGFAEVQNVIDNGAAGNAAVFWQPFNDLLDSVQMNAQS